MQFPRRTIPHKRLLWSVTKFAVIREGIRTWARILKVHLMNNGIHR